MAGLPVLTIDPPPAVGKHGPLLQQFWLRPPLASTQIGFPDDGSVVMLTQALLPAQLLLPQPPEPQLSSCTGRPCGSPGFAAHGFGPASVAIPVVSGSRMSSGAASDAGSGGQDRERSYVLSPDAWPTTTVASTAQLLF